MTSGDAEDHNDNSSDDDDEYDSLNLNVSSPTISYANNQLS